MNRNNKGQFKRVHKKWSLSNFNDGFADAKNYFRVYCPNHPRAKGECYLLRSFVAWEHYHRRRVPIGYVVHHIDKNTLNDKKDNLLLVTQSEHQKTHAEEKLIEMECHNCHIKFKINKWKFDSGKGKFCSPKCYFSYPKSLSTKNKVGLSLKKAYAEGRR